MLSVVTVVPRRRGQGVVENGLRHARLFWEPSCFVQRRQRDARKKANDEVLRKLTGISF